MKLLRRLNLGGRTDPEDAPMKWPLCPCCGRAHWPRYTIRVYAPIVTITPTPRYDAAALVEAIAAFVGEKDFNCRELKDHAMVVEGPLRDAIGAMSPKQLGKALWAIKEKDFDGYCIERLGADKHGAIWRLCSR
jgi:hypothetical protein